MKLSLFTVDQANHVVVTIRPRLERLVRFKREFDALEQRIDALRLALSGASASNPDARDLASLVARRTRLARQIRDGIDEIHAHGALVKDLERGLVDFYSLMGDRLIFLCWQLGEDGVRHWHTLEGGFAGRQPLKPADRDR